jgi:hypothetical protein
MPKNSENIIGKGFDKRPENINRKGRPKMPDLREAVAKILAEEKDGRTALDAVLAALRLKAVKGDVRAAQELLDRAYGKPKQSIDHSSGGEKIEIKLVFDANDNAQGDS